MNKRCIVNVATGEFYCKMQKRLTSSFKKSFVKWHNDELIDYLPIANGSGIDLMIWSDKLPAGSRPHSESPYGFKVHAIKAAYEKGYTSILWLDSPAYAVKEDISPIFEKIEKKGYYAMSHIDPLGNYLGKECKRHFCIKDEDVFGLNLPSGSCYGFDITKESGFNLVSDLIAYEATGYFKSCDHNHRHDETILALCLLSRRLPIFTFDPLFQSTDPSCVIRSGELLDLTPNI